METRRTKRPGRRACPGGPPTARTAQSGAIARALETWWSASRRDLPWRRRGDPYAIWVAEVMLQQTRVATAMGYYERFLARFPSIAALRQRQAGPTLRRSRGRMS